MSVRSSEGDPGAPSAGEEQARARPQAPAQRSSTYPMSRLSAPHDLVRMAEEIQAADNVLQAVVGAELEAIARQMRLLREQAAEALTRARRDAELHRARCRFRKRPGEIYHLYRDANGQSYFSMLSPADWRGAPPHTFVGSYRLEVDMRFTPVEEIERRERERAAAQRALTG